MGFSKAEYAAKRVLNGLGVTGPQDLALLELIAWERGAMVRDKHLDGAEARLTVVGRKAIITVSTNIKDSRRRRFSIAHEFGHLEMHHHGSGLMLCKDQDFDDWGLKHDDANREQEANEFAAALLLPERFFAPLCKQEEPSLNCVAEWADTFNVSLTATTLRYLNFCDEACAVVFSQDGYIKWFRGSEEFEDIGVFINVHDPLDPSSLAASLFQNPTIRTARKRVKASTWFAPGRYRDDATIHEQSLAMPNYNAVLTFLWVDDDIEDNDGYWWL